jgi:hypothetical protein
VKNKISTIFIIVFVSIITIISTITNGGNDMPTPAQLISQNTTTAQISSFYTDKIGQIWVPAYGAVGDGVTDDTIAVQTAVNESIENGTKEVYFVSGKTYKITALTDIEDIAFFGSNVTITGGATITVNNFASAVADFVAHLADTAAHEDALNLAKRTVANVTYYVNDTTGNDTNNGTAVGTPLKTITAAVNKLPRIIDHPTIINVADGTYDEDVNINGYTGAGTLTLQGASSLALAANVIVNKIHFRYNLCQVAIRGFTANTTTDVAILCGYNGGYCEISSCRVTDAAEQRGIANYYTPYLFFFDCLISNRTVAHYTAGGKTWSKDHTAGTGNTYSLYAEKMGEIKTNGVQPNGVTSQAQGGSVLSDTTISLMANYTHDVSVAGIQSITGLPSRVKSITIRAWVDGTKKACFGTYYEATQNCNYVDGTTGNFGDAGAIAIHIQDSAGNYTTGYIQSLTDSSFDINWVKTGAGGTGTAKIYMDISFI